MCGVEFGSADATSPVRLRTRKSVLHCSSEVAIAVEDHLWQSFTRLKVYMWRLYTWCTRPMRSLMINSACPSSAADSNNHHESLRLLRCILKK